jgi:hypothetical protein
MNRAFSPRPLRLGKRAVVALVLVLLGGGGAIAGSLAFGSSPPLQPWHVSNLGTAIPAGAVSAQGALQTMNLSGAGVELMATRGDRAYYRIVATGRTCYGAGPAGPDYRLGQIGCTSGFPSQSVPILDFSVIHGNMNPDNGTIYSSWIYRSEGIAADGVAKVAITDPTGKVIAETPVLDNIYSFGSPPAGKVGALLAFGRTGKLIRSERLVKAHR